MIALIMLLIAKTLYWTRVLDFFFFKYLRFIIGARLTKKRQANQPEISIFCRKKKCLSGFSLKVGFSLLSILLQASGRNTKNFALPLIEIL